MNYKWVSAIIAVVTIVVLVWLSPRATGAPVGILLPILPAGTPVSVSDVQIVQGGLPSDWKPSAYIRLEMMLKNPNDRKGVADAVSAHIKSWAGNYGCSVIDVGMSFVDSSMSPPVLHFEGKCYQKSVYS